MTRSSSAKRAFATSLAKYGFNPLNRALMRLGIRPPGTALLETTGRKSGKTRRNPVTDGLDDDTFWIVAEHGPHAGYVRNIEANPRVRVLVAGRWRTGTAHLMQDDDPRQRWVRTLGASRAAVAIDPIARPRHIEATLCASLDPVHGL